MIILISACSLACVFAEDNSTLQTASDEISLPDQSEEMPEETLSSDDDTQNSTANDTPKEDASVSFSADDTNIVQGKYFSVKVSDRNGTGIANKAVYFKISGITSKVNTTSNGIAKLKINETPGTYTVKYTFNETGYEKTSGSSEILVISTKKSRVKASDYTAYYGFKNQFVVILKVGDLRLAGRTVKMTVNGKTYTDKTNSRGKAYFAIGLRKGTYKVNFSYAGEKNIRSSSGSAVIKVKKMPVSFKKVNEKVLRHKRLGTFQVKLVDARDNPLKNKKVKFIFDGKTYVKKTDGKGIVTINVKLPKGAYEFKFKFAKTSLYSKASKTYKVKVKSKFVKNNGLWLFAYDMPNVDLSYQKSVGTKHIFLNFKALESYGKSYVEDFITEAADNGIKVHIWMQIFYKSGKWYYPVKKGKLKYDLIDKKVKEAKKYAKIKGVAGVHFDYVRFPGNAYEYKNAVKAVNYFVKKASNAVHKVNSNLIVSAAVMPEPSSMKTYYAQDIPTMSKYLDVIVPMVYKGNYHAGYKWVYSVTKKFVQMSKGAEIWTGLQAYRSDENVSPIPSSELMNDADYSGFAGAKGVILFRYGLVNYFDFANI